MKTNLCLFLETKFTLNEAAAQAFVFFVAGFETSSSAFTLALYELALNESVQTTLQKEIDKVLEKYNNKLSYEALMEMEYLDWVIQGNSIYVASLEE